MVTPETNVEPLDSKLFHRAVSLIPSGVTLVTAFHPSGTVFSSISNSFCVLSSEPVLVALTLPSNSDSLVLLRTSGHFAISVLSEDQAHLAKRFATPGTPRFEGTSCHTLEAATLTLPGAALQLFCELQHMIPVGDSCLVVCAVRRLNMAAAKPLVSWRRAFFRLHLEYPFLADAATLHQFVRRWETCSLPLEDWTHSAHIAVSAFYAVRLSPEELFKTMKQGIVRFNLSVGIKNGPDSGYHETLTRFWSNIISGFVAKHAYTSPLQAAYSAVKLFGEDRQLHSSHYSFDVVRSSKARREWIPPDSEP